MKTLICLMPNPTDATSLYRGVGPLQSLKRRMGDVEMIFNPDISWATLKGCDAVFMQRPALDHHVRIIDVAQANRKPVWVDYDDDLFNVPRCNPTFRTYGQPKIQNNVSKMLAKADVVTVSTQALKAQVRGILARIAKAPQGVPDLRLNPEKVHLVPNAYDEEILAPLRGRVPERQLTLATWRGSATHDKDLMGFTPELCNVIGRHLHWTYNFVGAPFWWTVEQIEKVPKLKPESMQLVESLDPIDFYGFLSKTKPALVHVPLEDVAFNRSKSNIAWVEATHAGAVALAPDWPEWQRPGVITYKDHKEFEDRFDRFIRGEFDGGKLWGESRDYIADNLTLTKVNRLREILLRDMIERAL